MVVAGLILNIIGAVLLAFFGFPQPAHDEGFGLGLEDNTPVEGGTVQEARARNAHRKAMYRCIAFLGVMLLVVGFSLQLAAAV